MGGCSLHRTKSLSPNSEENNYAWEKQLNTLQTQKVAPDEVVRHFISNPQACYTGYGSDVAYEWPVSVGSRGLADIYVRALGKQLAYIHGILPGSDADMIIQHFAVEAEFVRMGVGKTLALDFARQLAGRYRTQKIIFSQRHPRPHDAEFFSCLGATPVPTYITGHVLSPTPDWHWNIARNA